MNSAVMKEEALPEGWRLVKFGDMAKHISKRVEPSETDLDIYVGLEHLDSDSLRIKRHGVPGDVAGQKLLVKKGQIIFGKRRAYQRKVAVADWDCICSAHAMVLEADPETVLPEFLPFFMQSDVFMNRAVAISEGSLSPTIKWKVLEMQKFVIPSAEEQKSIINFLTHINNVTEASDEALRSAEFVLNTTLMHLVKAEGRSESYTPGIVNDFFTLQRGFDLTKKQAMDGDVPVWSSSGLSYYHNEAMLYGESVITGRKGKLGDVYYLNEPCWPHDTTLFVKDFKGNHPKYVFWFLKSLHLERLDAATAVPTLNRNVVHKLECVFPNLKAQIEFAKTLDALQSECDALEKSCNDFIVLKKAVLNNKLSYEI